MIKVLIPSMQTSDAGTLVLAGSVESGLSSSTYFPGISPTVAQLTAAKEAYEEAFSAAQYGGRDKRSLKDQKKKELLNLLRAQAVDINASAAGDVVKLSTTGFPLSRERMPRILGIAQPRANYGLNSGELILYTPAVPGAVSYKHQYTDDAELKSWKEEFCSRAKCKIIDLAPGKLYYLRIVTIGTSYQSTISDVITKIAI